MKTAIEGVYKYVKEIKAGSFKDENGKTINYNDSYRLIFDQFINGVPKETELRITKELAMNLKPNYKAYDKIVINLDITIYSNIDISIRVVSIEKK